MSLGLLKASQRVILRGQWQQHCPLSELRPDGFAKTMQDTANEFLLLADQHQDCRLRKAGGGAMLPAGRFMPNMTSTFCRPARGVCPPPSTGVRATCTKQMHSSVKARVISKQRVLKSRPVGWRLQPTAIQHHATACKRALDCHRGPEQGYCIPDDNAHQRVRC